MLFKVKKLLNIKLKTLFCITARCRYSARSALPSLLQYMSGRIVFDIGLPCATVSCGVLHIAHYLGIYFAQGEKRLDAEDAQ